MSYWSTAPMDRQQAVMFAPTLDACISEDHPVRLFLEVLDSRDWRPWEGGYDGRRGQPPIHPKVMAGVILYGLTQGIRSSRARARARASACSGWEHADRRVPLFLNSV